MTAKTKVFFERFWSKVRDAGGCWEWTASVDQNGYGLISHSPGLRTAHRLSYQMTLGPIPAGMCVCHRCDNKLCVNPGHLFLGTHADNSRDMVAKGRSMKGRPLAARPRAPGLKRRRFTEADVIEIRRRYKAGDPQHVIAAAFSAPNCTIGSIVRRESWKHVTEAA